VEVGGGGTAENKTEYSKDTATRIGNKLTSAGCKNLQTTA